MAANQAKKPTSSPKKRRPAVSEQYPWTTNTKLSMKEWNLGDFLAEFEVTRIDWIAIDSQVVETLQLS